MFERPSRQKGPKKIGNNRILSKENEPSKGNSKGSFVSFTPFGRKKLDQEGWFSTTK